MATRVDREGMEMCISQINTQVEALISAATSINTVMGNLPQYWEGDAYNAAEATYNEQYKAFLMEKVPTMVKEFNDYIEGCKRTILDIDAQLAGR